MKTKKAIYIFLLSIFALTTFAQKDTIKTSNRTRFGLFINYKINLINVVDLNNRLKLYNYPELPSAMNSIGGQFYLYSESDKMFVKMGYDKILLKKENTTYDIEFNSFISSYDFAYNILDKKRLFLYPTLGVGFSYLDLKIIDKTNAPTVFNQAISNLNGMNEIYTNPKKTFWNLNIGTNMDWSITKNNNWFIGLEAGYRIQLSKIKWQTKNSNLSDAPDVNLSGFYVGIHLNFR